MEAGADITKDTVEATADVTKDGVVVGVDVVSEPREDGQVEIVEVKTPEQLQQEATQRLFEE